MLLRHHLITAGPSAIVAHAARRVQGQSRRLRTVGQPVAAHPENDDPAVTGPFEDTSQLAHRLPAAVVMFPSRWITVAIGAISGGNRDSLPDTATEQPPRRFVVQGARRALSTWFVRAIPRFVRASTRAFRSLTTVSQ